ncbi:MAG TPA: UvrD-helicase domain-containing protein [Burkholderiaceae bacterium]|nr:UvrD-helicase domain-containing protein [Burkholderiaceae bacterium]
MINTITIDQLALGALDRALIEDSWFMKFDIPSNLEGIRRVELGSNIYLFSSAAAIESGYLTVSCDIFRNQPAAFSNRILFERIIRVAMRHFDRNISVPISWQPYHLGQLLSVYAQSSKASKCRVYFDQNPDNEANLFAYAVTSTPQDLLTVSEDIDLYKSARNGLCDALLTEVEATPDVGGFGILLSEKQSFSFATEGTLDDWVKNRLNADQIKFVNKDVNQPIRLRGAAGTGKTQSMAVKCLKELYNDRSRPLSIAFITHSSALAQTVVRGMFHALDPSERWAQIKDPNGSPRLWLGTIYELAQERLSYQKKGLIPLSIDGIDGKIYQSMYIAEAVQEALTDPRVALGDLKDCPDLIARMQVADENSALVSELMNEFACVLDLDNISKGTADADRYVRSARESWQMELPTEAHRRVVLEIHSYYRAKLKAGKVLSMDQMIADFSRYLGTHEWDQLRERDGFDLIFVDEYHYFNRAEAMTLHSLFRPDAQHDGKWPLIMAYDLKQSSNESSFSSGIERFRNPGVGASVPLDLKTIYRSTPEITALLRDLDASFPAMDLEGEFATYSGASGRSAGATPVMVKYGSETEMVDAAFEAASRLVRNLEDGGSQVAILCLNSERFEKTRNAGRVAGKFVAITNREDLKDLRYARHKFVFSMPEYVAGLQFDTVFLIHADKCDYDDGMSNGSRRRYISMVYLGASRAANRVYVCASEERGGFSALFDSPKVVGSIIERPSLSS